MKMTLKRKKPIEAQKLLVFDQYEYYLYIKMKKTTTRGRFCHLVVKNLIFNLYKKQIDKNEISTMNETSSTLTRPRYASSIV